MSKRKQREEEQRRQLNDYTRPDEYETSMMVIS